MNSYNFQPPRYTYSDYKNWKEDWELVNGYPYQMLPSATPMHNLAIMNFIYPGKDSLKKNKNCDCLLFSELDWKIRNSCSSRFDDYWWQCRGRLFRVSADFGFRNDISIVD